MTRARRVRIKARENWYRDLWLLVLTVFLLFANISGQTTSRQARTASRQAQTAVHQQAKGRRFTIGVMCAAVSAIGEAGRDVIAPASQRDTAFTRALEKLGYPRLPVRRRQAQEAGRLYVQHISTTVQQQVGGKAAHLVRKDGTIDCRQLQRLSNAIVAR